MVELELELELGVGVRQVAVSKLFIFGQNKGFLLLLFFQPLKQLQLQTNRPFPSSLAPLFQNESKCETFHMKMSSACSFIFIQIKVTFRRMVST